ncbi:uncharacterized protein IAS62_006568 [Cryptococcus decagattii]|uniref:Uncharacterized protein n=1 Tax=Cryptococcus decagattii TaxID=1859122 RepID=A0ABZ2B447_9TREE
MLPSSTGIITVMKNKENTTGGRGHKAVAEGDSACSDEWKAKNGGAGQGAFKGKEDTGLFALVCRHDFCIKLINLFRSGERMMYPLAFLIWLLRYVDPTARLGLLYDIGCNFEAHLRSRGLFIEELNATPRKLHIGVSVFHAYAHIWPCQIRYNPRMMEGFGLTDGEGAERLWSFMVPLIRLNRTVNSSLRLSNIHFRVEYMNETYLTNLVKWMKKKYKMTNGKLKAAEEKLKEVVSKISEYEAQLKVGGLSEVEQMRLQLEESNATRQKVWRKLGEKKGKGMELKKEIVAKAAEVDMTLSCDVVQHMLMYEPIMRTRGGGEGALGQAKMAKVLQKLDNGKIKSAIQRPEEDVFWMDALFVREDKPWAINKSCREGIRALLQRDRCLEEQRRLDAELARMLRWAEERSKAIARALDECLEKGNALKALGGDSVPRRSVVPMG